jgi:hypothetical protein
MHTLLTEEVAEEFGSNGRQCVMAHREFKDSKAKLVPADLQTPINVVKMIPIVIAECK